MELQKIELLKALHENGWEVEELDNYDYHHWSKETWRVRSIWSQVGASAYVAFVLDPMEIRPEKEFAWAVSIYCAAPLKPRLAEFTLRLNHWKEDLPGFLKTLQRLRTESKGSE